MVMSNIKTFASLKNSSFCFFMGGMLCQMAGMNMQMMTRQLLVYRLTGSATILGTLSLAMALPMLFFGLFGGVIADRFQKRYVLQVGMFASAVIALGIGLILSLGYLNPENAGSWWILLVAAFIQGTVMGLMMPANQSIIPEIIGEELLMNALALNNLGMSLFRIIGPAIAGFLIDRIGFEAVYYTMAGLNLVAMVFVSLIKPAGSTTLSSNGNALADIKDGFRYLSNQRAILFVLVFSLLFILFTMPYMNLMPIFTDDILKVGATGMGVLLAIDGAGAGIAALFLASLPNKKRGIMFLLTGIVMGLTLAGFAFSRSWYLSMILVVFIGIAQTGNMTLSSTITQYYVEPQYRGRIMSILMMSFGLTGLGTFFTAVLADNIGVQLAVGGLALALFVITLLAVAFLPKVRRLD
jgi:MFS family permease